MNLSKLHSYLKSFFKRMPKILTLKSKKHFENLKKFKQSIVFYNAGDDDDQKRIIEGFSKLYVRERVYLPADEIKKEIFPNSNEYQLILRREGEKDIHISQRIPFTAEFLMNFMDKEAKIYVHNFKDDIMN